VGRAGARGSEGGIIVTHLSRILVAVDSSKASRRAFDHALALSKSCGAELVAVHAVPRTEAFGQDAGPRLTWTSRLRLRAEQAGVPFSVKIQHGDPADTVLLHVRTLVPDIIVVGTHQRRGLDRLRGGSIAERIAAKATVPVLVIPARGSAVGTQPFAHVAVAVDFGPASDRALEHVRALPGGEVARVTLLHVVPGFSGGMPAKYYRYGGAEYQGALVTDARRRLEQVMRGERPSRTTVDSKVLVGDVPTEISRVVAGIGADLLVVGHSTRGAVSRALFGTTGARLARTLRVPLLVVPAAPITSARQEGADHRLAA
jgi:nucleotide-binding universal stress UspA family protein